MTIAYVVSFALLVTAMTLALVRVERGPTMFDRILAVDVNAAAVLGIVAVGLHQLSQTGRPLCACRSPLQGHAVFHVLAAAAIVSAADDQLG